MPKLAIPAELEKNRRQLSRLANYIGKKSEISPNQAEYVAIQASEVAILAVQIAIQARVVLGDQDPISTVINDIHNAVNG
jgi:hypothetical protein